MPTFPREIIRLRLDPAKQTQPNDLIAGATPDIWRAKDAQIQWGLFFKNTTAPTDISNLVEVFFEIKNSGDRDGAPLVTKSILAAALDATLDEATWADGSKQHGAFALTYADTALALDGEDKKTFWWVIWARTNDSPERRLVLGAGNISVSESGAADAIPDAGTTPNPEVLSERFSFKAPVRVATTANITLSGAQTIDGVSVIAGERVLVKNQSTGSQNGIYVCGASAWARATDFDESADAKPASVIPVEEGSTNADKLFILSTNKTIVLGTTALNFVEISGGGGGGAWGSITGTLSAQTDLQTALDAKAEKVSLPFATKTTTATLSSTEVVALCTGGPYNVTLPAQSAGRRVYVKKGSGASAITILPASGTIDGAASYILSIAYESVELISDGTNWFTL